MTPSQLRRLPQGDVFDANCPSRSVVEMLSDKWTMLVLRTLQGGPLRFGELRRQLEGVTQKMLTQTLRAMERNGIATRTVYATMPPSVEYALSPLGLSVARIADQMCAWAQENMKEVLVARRAYDQAATDAPGVVKVMSGRRV